MIKLFIEEHITALYYLAQLWNPNKVTLTHQRVSDQSPRQGPLVQLVALLAID
jgi:hypothetical protein